MKVLQVHNFYQIHGGECAVVDAERKLLQEGGHEVVQFTKNSRDIDNMTGFNKMSMLCGIGFNRRTCVEIVTFVEEHGPDVAHVHNVFPLLSPGIYRALKDSGIPVVQTHHNYRALCPNGLFYVDGHICEDCRKSFSYAYRKNCVKNNRAVSYLYARAISTAWSRGIFLEDINRHIALNRFFARKLVQSGIPDRKIRICGNYIDRFAEKAFPKDPHFLFLGRLSVEKGLFVLLEAAGKTGAAVKIAGVGPLEPEIRSYVDKHGLSNVELVGFATGEQKEELLKRCLAAIVPSQWYENFPVSVVEAQASGAPVIASRIGGLPEIIEEGRTGFLFEPGNASELAALMDRVLRDRQVSMQMADNALKRAREQFDPQIHLSCLEKVYREAVSGD